MSKYHEPSVCERVPYTAYYASGKWSCQFRCAVCGELLRHSVVELGLRELQCDGLKMEAGPPKEPAHELLLYFSR